MILTSKMSSITLNDNEIIIVNLLSGAVNILNNEIYQELNDLQKLRNDYPEVFQELVNDKFLFENNIEEQKYFVDLISSINELDIHEAPNFVILPTYDCNLHCVYCYESTTVQRNIKDMSEEQAEAVKRFIEYKAKNYDSSQIRITLMGGEPLLIRNKQIIEDFLNWANILKYKVDIVTNGTTIHQYEDILKRYDISSLQITVDGPKNINDKRRISIDEKGSFDNIIEGIDLAIKNKIKTYIRVNIDVQNISHLKDLAKFLINRYGSENKYLRPYLYVISDGGCLGDNYCIPEVEAVKKIIDLSKNNECMDIYDLVFHGSNFIKGVLNSDDYFPQNRFCAANKKQYVLGAEGNIYKCWFGVGEQKFALGTYYPDIQINESIEKLWEKRCVENIPRCYNCKFSLICGGGCNNKAMSANLSIMTPNCADFDSLLKLGFSYYIERGDMQLS
ncbi:radical SAM protein [Sedimentibacter hydroxybenzoicus DSM 7310]|uniref:Radical SAM protein n=2 Tax=Sedimentibacter hydroxybenzoicus TaxID=29345 RepID=A0A974BHI8_SEDHY|nr:radical SAM protein [Sedimentibacter hydroxybenzoicus DSM 7310]